MADKTPLLEVKDLELCYGSRCAFRHVSLALHQAEILGVVGPSGCGKSSLLSCLNRLAELNAGVKVRGIARLEGQDIYAPQVDVVALRAQVGMIFQRPNIFPTSIFKNVAVALKARGLVKGRAALDEAVCGALVQVGLWEQVKDRLKAPALALSGGQQQRLCIARAVALKPKVLLMDEPCSALDPVSTATIEALIRSLSAQMGVMIVTHNIAQARRLTQRLALLWPDDEGGAGRLIAQGPTEAMFEAAQDKRVSAYLGGQLG